MASGTTEAVNDGRFESVLNVEDGAEAFVEVLNANGVEYIFLNPGTDTVPIQEAIARLRDRGRPTPRVILCLYESLTMTAAHGFFAVSGRPQVAMVHVDVGTQNVGAALTNAYKGQAGVVLAAGRTPLTTEGELRGGRTGKQQWAQEPMDQSNLVRDNVKWLYELRVKENINHVVQRAFQIARTEPCGPVYLMLPREILMSSVGNVGILPPARHGPSLTPTGDGDRLAEVAEMLVRAEYPLILTTTTGRHPSAVAALVELAELLAIPVVEARIRMNFPTDHPMHLGFTPSRHFEKADVVLCLDCEVPYVPAAGRPRTDAKIIHVAIDPVQHTYPLWTFPADLSLVSDTSKSLPVITAAAREIIRDADRARIEERRQQVTAGHRAMMDGFDRVSSDNADRVPIHSAWLARCIQEVIGDGAIYFQEATTQVNNIYQEIRISSPGTFFSNGHGALGWAIGAALGAKLAAPEKDVVCLVGDGSFNFSSPIACLWAADAYHAPFLTVIFNNASYNAVKVAMSREYPNGVGSKGSSDVGFAIAPPPEYELVARSCRAYAETITDPAEVKPALQRAMEQVRGGRAAVLDVRVG